VLGALVGKAFLLGLSTGLFCAGFCLPLAAPVLFSRRRQGMGSSAAGVGLFLLGRLAAYLLVGLVTGLLGGLLTRLWAVKAVVLPVLYVLLGVLMIVYAVAQSFPDLGLCRRLNPKLESNWYLLLLGFVAGVNLCPPFVLALAAALDAGGVLHSVVFFLVFFLATSVYLVPLVFAGGVTHLRVVRILARVMAVVAGLYFIWLAARVLFF
jgi:sulfite exporter TauE/SafE